MLMLCDILAGLFLVGGLFVAVMVFASGQRGNIIDAIICTIVALSGFVFWRGFGALLAALDAMKIYLRDLRNLLRVWQDSGFPGPSQTWATRPRPSEAKSPKSVKHIAKQRG